MDFQHCFMQRVVESPAVAGSPGVGTACAISIPVHPHPAPSLFTSSGLTTSLQSLPWKKTAQNSYFYGNSEAVSGFRAVLEVTLPLLWAPTSPGDEVPTEHLPAVHPKPQPPEQAVPACSSPWFHTPPSHLERGEAVCHQEPAGREQH